MEELGIKGHWHTDGSDRQTNKKRGQQWLCIQEPCLATPTTVDRGFLFKIQDEKQDNAVSEETFFLKVKQG